MAKNMMVGTPNWENRTLFWGDNLDVLRAMNSSTVDLIATDPPFNKSKDFHATPESLAAGSSFQDRWEWRRDVDQEWLDQITDDYPLVMNVIYGSRNSYGDDMGAFLAFMAVRLIAMKRVLKPTGSIFLHCDPTASHYLKELMDAIFGRKNFKNEIIWHYTGGGRSKSYFSRKHDNIFWYTKSDDYVFNLDAIRVPYKESSGYAKTGITSKSGKKYLPHPDGTPVDDVWDIPIINPLSKERLGYPTQKPLELYERIVAAASPEDGVILDPFCGCATTLIAAERLGRKWVGIDIWEGAPQAVLSRLNQVGLVDDSKGSGNYLFDSGEFFLRKDLPTRTDSGEVNVPYLKVKTAVLEPEQGKKMSRSEMYDLLLSQNGAVCQGCDRKFDDIRYLELDHNTPRSDGGLNHVSNRVLLCSPCNRAKSNHLTLSGLRKLNKQRGWMAKH